jgi:hypothetical protein
MELTSNRFFLSCLHHSNPIGFHIALALVEELFYMHTYIQFCTIIGCYTSWYLSIGIMVVIRFGTCQLVLNHGLPGPKN